LGPIALLLSRGWMRFFVIVTFVAFHLGLALCFSIGLFPYVCIVAFSAFLPSQFWRIVLPRTNEGNANCNYLSPSGPLSGVIQKVVIVLALLTAVWSNLESLQLACPMPESVRNGALAFRWPQSWRLFVDLKEVDDGWFVFHAQFADGTSHDLLTGASPVS